MTTLGDTFARADNTDLNAANTGKTLNGSAATWQWTEVENDSQIASNRLSNVSTPANVLARAEQDLASSDHEVQAVLLNTTSATTTFTGLVARFSASAQDGYVMRTNQGNCWLYSMSAGTLTEIATVATGTGTASGVLCKLSCIGTSIVCTIDGVDVISVTDSTFTSGVRVGAFMRASGANRAKLESFFAQDVAGGTDDYTSQVLQLGNRNGIARVPTGGAGLIVF